MSMVAGLKPVEHTIKATSQTAWLPTIAKPSNAYVLQLSPSNFTTAGHI